jgi:hypothetical protein
MAHSHSNSMKEFNKDFDFMRRVNPYRRTKIRIDFDSIDEE